MNSKFVRYVDIIHIKDYNIISITIWPDLLTIVNKTKKYIKLYNRFKLKISFLIITGLFLKKG